MRAKISHLKRKITNNSRINHQTGSIVTGILSMLVSNRSIIGRIVAVLDRYSSYSVSLSLFDCECVLICKCIRNEIDDEKLT